MTYEQYVEEHGHDYDYDEGLPIGRCAYCGEDVWEGEPHYAYQGDVIHAECAAEFIESEFSTEYIAQALGMERK